MEPIGAHCPSPCRRQLSRGVTRSSLALRWTELSIVGSPASPSPNNEHRRLRGSGDAASPMPLQCRAKLWRCVDIGQRRHKACASDRLRVARLLAFQMDRWLGDLACLNLLAVDADG